ncbi:MAG: alpha/beta hydrolase [Glaciecola sp.]|nr:alpha/beta hydrolase [Glaciecola sp.]
MANQPSVFVILLLYSLLSIIGVLFSDVTFAKTKHQYLENVPYLKVSELPTTSPNYTYTYGQNEHQYIAFWTGKGSTKKAPIIMIHGGCWLSAFDMQHSIAQANGLAAEGHDVYSLEYRRTGKSGGGWPTTFEDVQMGTQHVINMLDKDVKMLNLIGHSAGGHLALLAASDIQRHLTSTERDDIRLNVIGLAAITDIAQYSGGDNSCQSVTKDFMQGMPEQVPASYFMANPINIPLTDPAISNVTLLQGDADTIVSVKQARHQNGQTVIVPNAGHFDWLHPQSQAFQQLLEVLR